ncbi:hypothetical protein Athai_60670 [Actinocatenispora thailandica]|uniref:Uncharacterized protein n=1 Tax=Actinocatenispora thailandica TaxID=227318 RepID=A0A7R7DVD0_9ACTN|nr:hypothetical protein [Actinocatenispora thailandica]BCJ38564.1 hypothetical protein Athai_60670 [Actinocatenispora thailandica]
MRNATIRRATKGSWCRQVRIPDTVESQEVARAAVRDCVRHRTMGDVAALRGTLIAAGLAADIHHAHAGPAVLTVRWREYRRHGGVLSLTLDKPAASAWSMPELTELTLDLMATDWAAATGEHTCRVDARVEDPAA